MKMICKTIALIGPLALLLSCPVMARQLQNAPAPVVVTPSGEIITPDPDEISTVTTDGNNTTTYRTHRRARQNSGMSGYSTGNETTDAFTGALLGNIMGGIVSDQIDGQVKQNKQFKKYFPDHDPGASAPAPALDPLVDNSSPAP